MPLTGQHNLYASAVVDIKTREIILKIVNTSDNVQNQEVVLEGVGKLPSKGKITTLKSEDLAAVNTLDDPKEIAPVEAELKMSGKKVNLALAPYSLSVVTLK